MKTITIRRAIYIMCIATIFAATSFAQNTTVKKPRVYIEHFELANGMSQNDCDLFRTLVISALDVSDRFNLLDADTQTSLSEEAERRSDASALHDELARKEAIGIKANNYILRGALIAYSIDSEMVEGKTRYTYNIEYTITMTDATKSEDVISRTFSHGATTQSLIGGTGGKLLNQFSTYSSKEDAVKAAWNNIGSDIKNLLIEELPLEGEVIAEDYEVKKGKLISFYINIGTGLGVKVGDYFSIRASQVRAGRTISQEIGRMKVKEVFEDDPALAFCVVTKGGKEVYEAMEEYQSLAAEDSNATPLTVRSTKSPIISF